MFLAWRCLACNCVHGWMDHPAITKVTRHHRGSMEDVWWCPGCGAQHRTHDGTALGQVSKRWEELTCEADLEWTEYLFDGTAILHGADGSKTLYTKCR